MRTPAKGTAAALITRTEFLSTAARVRRTLGAILLLGAAPLLVVLTFAGLAPGIIASVVGGAVTGSLALAVTGPPTTRRAAVRLGLVDEQILIGTDNAGAADSADIVRPLSELTGLEQPRTPAPETHIDAARQDLRIQGNRYLRLTFADGAIHLVAVPESDPVAAEIIRRLREALPSASAEESVPAGEPATEASAVTVDSGAPGKRAKQQPASTTDTTRAITGQPADDRWPSAPSASPAADIRLWEAARTTHRRVLSEYGAYELDPTLFLRYPGVTDITRDPVMDFHTALAEAQALATDAYPGDAGYAGRYRAAVDTLRRTWIRCERDGKATGTGYLHDNDRSDLDTAAKLYNHAQATDNADEKASYLRKAQRIIVDLEARGRVHLPRPVVAALEAQVRLALEPGTAAS
ncbi:hypothetical protein [Nocardia flavorosea]|uniref:Uncharacterized protein n=1 Tax=Nocardia flavorosea TaxID=53429 RepID=A0A846YH02_9NOCA|nr:hypothetical protein [Nocardia flavorosea]NKY58267.1 hypothetical protein [Nocardia flavorosea]